jgi:hypothetical protein
MPDIIAFSWTNNARLAKGQKKFLQILRKPVEAPEN